jgi:hypothetical protein
MADIIFPTPPNHQHRQPKTVENKTQTTYLPKTTTTTITVAYTHLAKG